MLYSVIIPTYNRCSLLQDAIDSVLQQDYSQLEIIVVDDGSTDATATIIADRYPFVRYIYQYNQGPAAARNQGIAAANGELIAFLDSDDIWLDDKIAIELKLLHGFPHADALAGNASALLKMLCAQQIPLRNGILHFPNNSRVFLIGLYQSCKEDLYVVPVV